MVGNVKGICYYVCVGIEYYIVFFLVGYLRREMEFLNLVEVVIVDISVRRLVMWNNSGYSVSECIFRYCI